MYTRHCGKKTLKEVSAKLSTYSYKLTLSFSGLGAIICEKFAKEGSNVAINYQSSKEAAEKLAEELTEKYKVQAFALQADQGIEADCERMVTDTIERFGGIDIIVSNAVRPPLLPFPIPITSSPPS